MMKNVRGIALASAGIAVVLALGAAPALAQKPTQEQIDAIRNNCKADFAKLCPGVPPGGRALLCLRGNIAKVSSAACRDAVNAVK